jgi:uncharacterized membrane protein YbaN (DUF454 family)
MIETAAGLGMSLIAGEHFFSTFLSSPWTTQKFADSEEEKALVRKMYWYATACSLITAAILSYILKQSWPLIAAIILCIIYIVVYERALKGEL